MNVFKPIIHHDVNGWEIFFIGLTQNGWRKEEFSGVFPQSWKEIYVVIRPVMLKWMSRNENADANG